MGLDLETIVDLLAVTRHEDDQTTFVRELELLNRHFLRHPNLLHEVKVDVVVRLDEGGYDDGPRIVHVGEEGPAKGRELVTIHLGSVLLTGAGGLDFDAVEALTAFDVADAKDLSPVALKLNDVYDFIVKRVYIKGRVGEVF